MLVHLCVQVHVYALCVEARSQLLRSCLRSYPQVFLLDLELDKQAVLAGPWAPKELPVSIPQCWVYKHTCPTPQPFKTGSEGWTLILVFTQRTLYPLSYLPSPLSKWDLKWIVNDKMLLRIADNRIHLNKHARWPLAFAWKSPLGPKTQLRDKNSSLTFHTAIRRELNEKKKIRTHDWAIERNSNDL